MKRDVAAVGNCVMCDTYFVMVVTTVDLNDYRGRKGTRSLEEVLFQVQETLCSETHTCPFLPCPTCIELVYNMPFSQWQAGNEEAVLAPCLYVRFDPEESTPLYINNAKNQEVGKPKYNLIQGVGPQTLELDRSVSGRLWKPSLPIDKPVDMTYVNLLRDASSWHPARYRAMCDGAVEALNLAQTAATFEAVYGLLVSMKALYSHWDEPCPPGLAAVVLAGDYGDGGDGDGGGGGGGDGGGGHDVAVISVGTLVERLVERDVEDRMMQL
eukprot:TRINITY_DN1797_c1_g1_i1.p1 TRINITY_DN1797_c1_g1~~TRINITY_DN1797_c1_g1_i1.p1  ORF type:complete len:269 (+),score=51.02 TRINITY_DN1797_c1_g1_i1:469-1275(+)